MSHRLYAERLIFVAGLLIMLSAKLPVEAVPAAARAVPPEPDDAYTYIVKAVQLSECPLQDCRALKDLREQLRQPRSNPTAEYLRWDVYTRAFMVHHPLQSLATWASRRTSLSWERAHMATSVLGVLLVTAGIAVFLYVLWGPGPAGIALALIAFTPFGGHGLNYFVPGVIALGLAMLTWAMLVRRQGDAVLVAIVGVVALLAVHHIGKVYAIVTIVLMVLLARRPIPPRVWGATGIATGFVAAAFLIPLMVERPDLSLGSVPPTLDKDLLGILQWNFPGARQALEVWIDRFGGILPTAILVGIAIVACEPRQRRSFIALLVALGVVLVVSQVHFHPSESANLFKRLWLAPAVALSGAIGYAIFLWGEWAVSAFRGLAGTSGSSPRSGPTLLSMSGWSTVLILVLGILYVPVLGYHVGTGLLNTWATAQRKLYEKDYRLVPAQVRALVDSAPKCGRVLYDSIVVMHFYFSYGALRCGAVFGPALRDTPFEEEWLGPGSGLTHYATYGPFRDNRGRIPLYGGTAVTVAFSDGAGSQKPSFYFDNGGPEVMVTLGTSETDAATTLTVPAERSGWLTVSDVQIRGGQTVHLRVPPSAQRLHLAGFRLGSVSTLRWPWDQGISITIDAPRSEAAKPTLVFDTDRYVPLPGFKASIVNDSGSSVLWELSR